MDNYSYNSYPDSSHSSPRSRDVEFENPPPWDVDQQSPQNYKVKFMCSYGGKIHPRPHDNQLSYIGGETKILAVDRNIKFSAFMSKLALLTGADVSFKYQLPGEELDALISVTNDDDLEHLMHEYDRLYRGLGKPSRMRLFLFPANSPPVMNFGSESGKLDREQFVEALNSGPTRVAAEPVGKQPENADFLFGLDKGVPPPPLNENPVALPAVPPQGFRGGIESENRFVGSDPVVNPIGNYAGDYYVQKGTEKAPQVPPQGNFWPEKQIPGGGFPATVTGAPEQPLYMIPAPGHVYHTQPQMIRQTGQAGQGYYPMQRMGHEIYREQPMYGVVSSPQPPMQAALQPKMTAYTEGIPVGRGMVPETGTYSQMAYDSGMGRQVYYNAPAGVVMAPPYQGVSAAVSSGDMRSAGGGGMGQEGKMGTKV